MALDPTGIFSHNYRQHRGVPWKQPCRVATTANVTIATALNAGDTIDGVTLAAGDRVLVKSQSTGSQNGIYIAGATPVRAADMDQDLTTAVPTDEIAGAFVYVVSGTANGGKLFYCTNAIGGTLGSTSIVWAEFTGGSADAILRYDGAAEWLDDHGGAAVGATETINLANGNAHSIILDVNCTLTFSGASATIDGQDVASSFTLQVIQDATGGNTITWPGSVVWPGGSAPTLSTTGNAVEILTFWTPDGGTTWYGFHSGTGTVAAEDVSIADAGGYYTGTDVEAALQEIGADIVTLQSASGGGDHEHMIELFNGDGSTTTFEIDNEPVDPGQVYAFVAGTWTAITVSGALNTLVTFGAAPASGTDNVVIQYPALLS